MNDKDIMNKAIDTYGETNQTYMLMEECAELIQAISKYNRNCENSKNVIEEIADVEIMIEQVKMILERNGYNYCREEIEQTKRWKLDRLERRLNNEQSRT